MANCQAEPTSGTKPRVAPPDDNTLETGMRQDRAWKCTLCPQKFSKLQDCLKHELLEHNTKNERPRKTLRNKFNAVLKSLCEADKQTLRVQLSQALNECPEGQELPTIFKFHRMDAENLELVYGRIHTSLEEELQPLGLFVIHPFGSVASGLALRDCDIDFFIERKSPTQQSNNQIFKRINSLLHRSRCFDDIIAIRHARVPIIKCKHMPTGFSLDINLSCPNSVHNTNFLRDLMLHDARLHELMIFLKIWAKQLQLIDRGNMSSYCLIILVIFYLQQPQSQRGPVLIPAVKDLQFHLPPQLVLGVNYAYKLKPPYMEALPEQITSMELIQGFFAFWKQFEFEKLIAAPYLGTTVPLEQFKAGAFSYPAYDNQLHDMAKSAAPVEPLQTDRCMCVQDPFCLNHNVAKSMSPPNLEYFRKCMQLAHRICTEAAASRISQAKLYESLLYGVVEELARTAEMENSVGLSTNNKPPSTLSYRLTPCRAEMRALAVHTQTDESRELYRAWVQHYTEAITEIVTEIYCLDMQSATPTHSDKQQRLELEHVDQSFTWLISGSVDLWTGRMHQRNGNQTFMEYQLAQTVELKRKRRQIPSYAVQLNGVLTLNIIYDYTALELIVVPKENVHAGLPKKEPLRKFFAMLKCSMQSFNLKEKLQTETYAAKPSILKRRGTTTENGATTQTYKQPAIA